MATTIQAHFDGKVLVPDQPVDLPFGRPLTVRIEVTPVADTSPSPPAKWVPLNLPVNAELSQAIATEAEFDLEES